MIMSDDIALSARTNGLPIGVLEGGGYDDIMRLMVEDTVLIAVGEPDGPLFGAIISSKEQYKDIIKKHPNMEFRMLHESYLPIHVY